MSFFPKLALSALIGVSSGLGLVWFTIKAPPPGMTETLRDPGSASDAEAEAEPGSEAEAGSEAGAEAESESESESDAASDLHDPTRRDASEPTLRFRRGRVAYIRCGARERCPRDREFEEAVWGMLEALPTCPDGPRSPGSGDVRVHFEGETGEVRFRDWGAPLPLGPLRACLEPGMTGLSTRLGVRPLTASFRFELRPLR